MHVASRSCILQVVSVPLTFVHVVVPWKETWRSMPINALDRVSEDAGRFAIEHASWALFLRERRWMKLKGNRIGPTSANLFFDSLAHDDHFKRSTGGQ